jgi:hypothetical protein
MLCNVCKDIGLHFDDVFPKNSKDDSGGYWPLEPLSHKGSSKRSKKTEIHPGHRHHDSFASLIAAGKDGCELCSLLEQAVTAQINYRGAKAKGSNFLSMLIQEKTPMYIRAPWPFVGSVGSLRCTFPGFSQAGIVDTKIRVFCESGK